MKTKEFIEKVEGLGLKADKFDNDIVIGDTNRYYCCLSSKERYKMEVFHEHLEKLDEEVRHKMLDLVVEYSKTPTEEREELKKYCLSLPEPLKHDLSYLNLKLDSGTYVFSGKAQIDGYKTQFTQEEIDSFPNQEFIKVLIKEEVKE